MVLTRTYANPFKHDFVSLQRFQVHSGGQRRVAALRQSFAEDDLIRDDKRKLRVLFEDLEGHKYANEGRVFGQWLDFNFHILKEAITIKLALK